jgi:signal transduction histidine kinase
MGVETVSNTHRLHRKLNQGLRAVGSRCPTLDVDPGIATVHKALLLVCVWLAGCAGGTHAAAAPNISGSQSQPDALVLTNAAQVLALSPEQTQAHPEVLIRGLVTYYENGIALFVQDESAGIYVYNTSGPLNVRPGQFIEVSGMANRGRYSPIIDFPKIRLIEAGPAIKPKAVTLDEIALGGLDAQWVELRGVVRKQHFAADAFYLELAVGAGRIGVRIPGINKNERPPKQLEGSVVKVTGVVGTRGWTEKNQISAFQIFANSLQDCAIIEASPNDAFSYPHVEAGDLQNPRVRRDDVGRVCLNGIVTLCRPGDNLFIQDSTGGVEVRAKPMSDVLVPGDVVEVAGFLGPVLEAPLVEDAVVRKVGTDRVPKPGLFLAEDLLQGRHNQELVELEATFLEWANAWSNRPTLGLEAQGHFLTARLDLPNNRRGAGVLPELQSGCRVRLTGVSYAGAALPGMDPSLCLLLRSPADVKVLGSSALGNQARLQLPVAIATLTGAGLVAALWYTQKQRRQTEHILQLQATLQSEMLQGEQQLRRSMEERDRIGRDLHDDIIQSIYAVGLNLEDCRRVVRQSPEQAEARVASAINTLNNTIRSVRGFLAGLEPKVVNGREFKTALKSLALTSGDGPTPFQIDVDPSAANSLTSVQATQLLHIAKEAMSNSLRHGQASIVSVSLHPITTGVRLEIRDNGAGFVPEATPGTGHGLRNMTARAREIGAELKIASAPGQGCHIVVTVPQRNANERI